MVNSYSVPLKYLVNSNSHLNFEFEGKIKFIAFMYLLHYRINCSNQNFLCTCHNFSKKKNFKDRLVNLKHLWSNFDHSFGKLDRFIIANFFPLLCNCLAYRKERIEILKSFFRIRVRNHNTSFSSLLINGPNKLECYIALSKKGLSGANALAYWSYLYIKNWPNKLEC
jgi:hypothetical protein